MRFGLHLRYFVRTLLLLVPIFAIWWTLLLDPALGALRLTTEGVFRVCLGANPPAEVAIEPAGNWFFRVPVPSAVARRDEIQRLFGRTSPTAPLVNVRSLRLEIPGRDPSLFLVSLPFFWAMTLATELSLRTLRALAAGTFLLLPLAVALLAFDVVRTFIVNTHLVISGFVEALLHASETAALNLIPYLAPMLLAFALHRGLRMLVFSWEVVPAASPAPGATGRSSRTAARRATLES